MAGGFRYNSSVGDSHCFMSSRRSIPTTLNAMVLFLALPAAGVVHLTRPPSSLRPKADLQQIRVSHAHHRVRACVADGRGTQMECTSRLEDSDAATVVSLRRSREPKSTADELASRVLVELPHGSGRQSRTLRVRVGDWFLEWPGCSVERIRVT